MKNFLVGSLLATTLSFVLAGSVLADADPSVHEIYEAASSGHLDQAQTMMDEVLRNHPDSSKAHYVQSELYAREGKLSLARTELARAEQLAPGLPKENPRSVAELKSELGLIRRHESIGEGRSPASHFPWGTIVILALVVGVCWTVFRRRVPETQSPGYGTLPPRGAPPAAPGTYAPATPVPGAPVGGGIGSAVAGGLAGGLAAGAGVVAGEALAHHLLEGGHPEAPPTRGTDDDEHRAANEDMGGSDFGVNDPDSWDDRPGAGGDGNSGGDDWN